MEATTQGPAYKDRSTGLVLFGVLELIIGSFLGMMAIFGVVAVVILRNVAGMSGVPAPSLRTMAQSLILYLVLSAFFIICGVGSIRGRRWARALMLVVSWMWLAVGVLTTALMGAVMPTMMETMFKNTPGAPAMPPALMSVVYIFMMVFLGIFLVLLPGGFVLYYRQRDVRLTCEAKDPVPRWTDRAPLPVLGLAVMMGYGALSYVMMSVTMPVLPLFGVFVGGWAGGLGCLVLGALWAYLARSVYRLELAGWWGALAVPIVLGLSTIETFLHRGLIEFYEKAGFDEMQLQLLRKTSWMQGGTMVWMVAGAMVPYLGYVLWLRRYFTRARTAG